MLVVDEVISTSSRIADERAVNLSNISLGVIYCFDSLVLLGATFILIKTLNEDFSGTALKNETLVLKVIFFIFTIGYLG
jgi:hypothetical protein